MIRQRLPGRRPRAPRLPPRKPRCGLCNKQILGGYKKVAGKPRCYWCCKRLGNV